MFFRISLVSVFLFTSLSSLAGDSERIKELEARIKSLENQVGSKNGLKTKDLGGKTSDKAESPNHRIPSSNQKGAITPEQKKQFMDSINAYKKRQKEAQKFLDQLEEEGL